MEVLPQEQACVKVMQALFSILNEMSGLKARMNTRTGHCTVLPVHFQYLCWEACLSDASPDCRLNKPAPAVPALIQRPPTDGRHSLRKFGPTRQRMRPSLDSEECNHSLYTFPPGLHLLNRVGLNRGYLPGPGPALWHRRWRFVGRCSARSNPLAVRRCPFTAEVTLEARADR